jgi:hypothetical protein
MPDESVDHELAAIRTVLEALTPLKPEARSNVIDYVFRRLGIVAPAGITAAHQAAPQSVQQSAPTAPSAQLHAPPPGAPTDLRSLTELKQPKSANQMVALLAYYLANVAPADQRRDHVVAEDIKKYFPQANFEEPTGPHSMTLVNAKNAGYLDAVGAGQYRLNPVGRNLVMHKLPRGEGTTIRGSRRAKRSSTKKQVKNKKVRS